MVENGTDITIKMYRFDQGRGPEGYFEEITVASREALSVMALLAKIHAMDPTFACRTSICFKGKCGSCLVRVNGQDVFGCTTLVHPGETVVIEPHSKFKVMRDVVVDFSQPLKPGKE